VIFSIARSCRHFLILNGFLTSVMSQLVKDLDLKAFHNRRKTIYGRVQMSQLVKDLDLKAFHNRSFGFRRCKSMSQLVKDLDLKAFHNASGRRTDADVDVTARQRS